MSAHVVISCDHPMEGGTCARHEAANLPLERAVAEIRRRGWYVTFRGVALCPEHRGGAR